MPGDYVDAWRYAYNYMPQAENAARMSTGRPDKYVYFSHLEKPQISQLQASPDAVFFAARDGWFLLDHKTTEDLMANKKGSKKRRIKGVFGAAGAGKSVVVDSLAFQHTALNRIVPRTKREKAIAAQEYHQGRTEGYASGHDEGVRRGADAERRHGEELLCRVVAAAKS